MDIRVKDRKGERYGMISVVSFAESRKNKAYWNVICDCGVTKIVRGEDLPRNKHVSCGCKKKLWRPKSTLTGAESPFWQGIGSISKDKFCGIRIRALRKKIPFTITHEYISELYEEQEGKCALTGIKLTVASNSRVSDGTYSLDRIDSSKGYIPGNVQWIHKELNSMKMAMSQDRFVEMCIAVAKHQQR
jgi:hypothetical protein